MKLEVVLIGVSDIDRAKAFYQKLGWRFDGDFTDGGGFRIVQMTPHKSQAGSRRDTAAERLRANAECAASPCRHSGRVWLDEFSLQKLTVSKAALVPRGHMRD